MKLLIRIAVKDSSDGIKWSELVDYYHKGDADSLMDYLKGIDNAPHIAQVKLSKKSDEFEEYKASHGV